MSLGRDISTLTYGMQEPVTNITAGVLGTDLNGLSRGPSYFFQAIFDKLVILPEAALSPASAKARRLPDFDILSKRQNTIVQAGDRPWFCHWNSTLLEVFIYANITSVPSAVSGTTSTSASPSSNPTIQPPYPKVVKIEDIAMDAIVSPYCEHIRSWMMALRLQWCRL